MKEQVSVPGAARANGDQQLQGDTVMPRRKPSPSWSWKRMAPSVPSAGFGKGHQRSPTSRTSAAPTGRTRL